MSWATDVKIHHQSFGGEAEEWATWTDDDRKTRRVPIRKLFDGESRCNLEHPTDHRTVGMTWDPDAVGERGMHPVTEPVTCARLAGHDGPHVELDHARGLSFVIAP